MDQPDDISSISWEFRAHHEAYPLACLDAEPVGIARDLQRLGLFLRNAACLRGQLEGLSLVTIASCRR